MARLAKEWNSEVPYDGYISGRSSIFELLGITAGRDEEKKNPRNPSLVNALKRFFGRVLSLQSQIITYYDFYKESDVPQHVKSQKPLLLDPANPLNNFMHTFPSGAYAVFSRYARTSQAKLDRVQDVSDMKQLF